MKLRTEIIYILTIDRNNLIILFLFSDTMDLTDDEAHLPRPAGTPGSHALYSLDRCSSLNKFEVPSSNGSSSGETSSSNKDSSGATQPTCTLATQPTLETPTFFVTSCQSSDMDGGSHSSEEELEEKRHGWLAQHDQRTKGIMGLFPNQSLFSRGPSGSW